MGAKLIECIEHLAEFIGIIRGKALGGDGMQALEDPPVEQGVWWINDGTISVEIT